LNKNKIRIKLTRINNSQDKEDIKKITIIKSPMIEIANIEITSIENTKNMGNEVNEVKIMVEVLRNTNKKELLMNKKEIKSLKSQLKKMKIVSHK
jgi:hypothetical protein